MGGMKISKMSKGRNASKKLGTTDVNNQAVTGTCAWTA